MLLTYPFSNSRNINTEVRWLSQFEKQIFLSRVINMAVFIFHFKLETSVSLTYRLTFGLLVFGRMPLQLVEEFELIGTHSNLTYYCTANFVR